MWNKSKRWIMLPVAAVCLSAAGCSSWMHSVLHPASQTVAAITQSRRPTGPVATNPAVVILRPAMEAAAQAAGPWGGEAMGIIAAIASLVAGATGTVAARTQGQLSRHKQAISELAKAVAPGTILHPATQRLILSATS